MHARTHWSSGWLGLSVALTLLAAGHVGCSKSTPKNTKDSLKSASPSQQGELAMTLTIQIPAFASGERIPKKYTGEGDDVSPALSWTGTPDGTTEFALIMDDPDAPSGTWVHWVIAQIPAAATGLKEGITKTARPDHATGVVQGKNSWPKTGYNGPMPPRGHGPHRYFFKLYALDTALALPPGFTRDDLLAAMNGHILAQAEYVGTYER